jgi:serine/threonine-protein phosphatase 6 regulatory ankyrin repeat subunit B
MSKEEELLTAAKSGDLAGVRKSHEAGANIDTQDDNFSQTALHIAASEGHLEIARYLVEKGADLLIQDAVDMTPIHLAARDGKEAVLQLLLDSIDEIPDRIMSDIMSVAQMSVSSTYRIQALVGKFRSRTAKVSTDSLSKADAKLIESAWHDRVDDIKDALNAGANIEVVDGKGMSPLVWASLRGNLKSVSLLLEKGANVNCQNRAGWTPLIQASAHGHLAVVRVLLESGADVNKATIHDESALMFTAGEGYLDIVELLIANGADVSARDSDKLTALQYAMRNDQEHLYHLLQIKGKKGLSQG